MRAATNGLVQESQDEVRSAAPVDEGPDRSSDELGSFADGLLRLVRGDPDLAHGQMVIIWARWVLVVAGLVLSLWDPTGITDLRIQVALVLALAGANFYLHSQVLMRRPAIAPVAYAASAADLAVITLIIFAGDRFASTLFVFYFPAILAYSVAFRTEVTGILTAAVIGIYWVLAMVTGGGDSPEVLAIRMLMMAGVAFCGNLYWRVERDRRRASSGVDRDLSAPDQVKTAGS